MASTSTATQPRLCSSASASDGRVLDCAPPNSPADFLRSHGRGPYSAFLVNESWPRHMSRLSASARALAQPPDDSGSSATTMTPHQAAARAKPTVDAAVAALSRSTDTHNIACVCLFELTRDTSCPSGVSAVHAFAWTVSEQPRPSVVCVAVGSAGARGPHPAAKDSAWATQRVGLEASVAEGECCVLSRENGDLLEGLVSNVFVLQRLGPRQADTTETPSESNETEPHAAEGPSFELVTAPASLVYPGVMRALVLEAASSLVRRSALVSIRFACPRRTDKAKWECAFVTNAVRGVVDVAEVRWGDDSDSAARLEPCREAFEMLGLLKEGVRAARAKETDTETEALGL